MRSGVRTSPSRAGSSPMRLQQLGVDLLEALPAPAQHAPPQLHAVQASLPTRPGPGFSTGGFVVISLSSYNCIVRGLRLRAGAKVIEGVVVRLFHAHALQRCMRVLREDAPHLDRKILRRRHKIAKALQRVQIRVIERCETSRAPQTHPDRQGSSPCPSPDRPARRASAARCNCGRGRTDYCTCRTSRDSPRRSAHPHAAGATREK